VSRRALAAICIASACSCSRGAGSAAAAPLAAVPASELAAVRSHGRQLFLRHCALCHGEEADGHGVRASNFERPPADLHRAEFHGDAAQARVLQSIREGLPGTPMPSWKSALSEGDLRALTLYVVHLEEDPDVPGLRMR